MGFMLSKQKKLSFFNGPILFDIDRTLFDTKHFALLVREKLAILAKTDLNTLAQFENSYSHTLVSRSQFDPKHYCEYLSNKLHVPFLTLMQEFTQSKNFYSQSLFSDTLPVLESLKNKGTQLGIFSEGVTSFQKMKIEYSGIISFLNREYIYLFEEKLSSKNLKRIPANVLIIDNNKDVVTHLSKTTRCVIWINRESSENHPNAVTVSSLTNLVSLLT